ncbi:MAG: hypothetical protein R6T92_10035 [Desulfosalsimonadaceae bacterium]
MPFVKMPGLKGMIYVPEADDAAKKKHACKDCFSCQMCGDNRCSVCLGQTPTPCACPPVKKSEKP